jgi:hypothetical protein
VEGEVRERKERESVSPLEHTPPGKARKKGKRKSEGGERGGGIDFFGSEKKDGG